MEQPRQRDPFHREMWQDRLHAVSSSWKLILLLMGLGAVFLLLGLFVTRTSSQPGEPDEGQVVRFGSRATDEGDRPLIIVKLRDGTEKQLFIHRAQIQTCRVGARIQLVRKGDWLGVHRRACLVD